MRYQKQITPEENDKFIAKLLRNISIAVQVENSTDPKCSTKLEMAILAAKAANVPDAKIQSTITKASTKDGSLLKEVIYEGFGISDVGVLLETVTNDTKRTFNTIQYAFNRHGGSLGPSGCVKRLFKNVGLIRCPAHIISEEKLFDMAIGEDAHDFQKVGEEYEIVCSCRRMRPIKVTFERALGVSMIAEIIWRPNKTVLLDNAKTEKILKMLDSLADISEVQNVWSNLEISKPLE